MNIKFPTIVRKCRHGNRHLITDRYCWCGGGPKPEYPWEYPCKLVTNTSRSYYFAEGWSIHINALDAKTFTIWKLLLSGRFWLSLNRRRINHEWHLFSKTCSLMLSVGGGDSGGDVGLSFGIPFLGSFYWTLERILPERLKPTVYIKDMDFRRPVERSTGIRIFSGSVWISVWEDQDSWDRSQRGLSRTLHVIDWIFGRQEYSSIELNKPEITIIHLPEKSYPAAVSISKATWKRKRWYATTRTQIKITSLEPFPRCAGKGENSWDQQDQVFIDSTVVADTVEEAIRIVTKSVLADRKKYGMPLALREHHAEDTLFD